MMAQIIMVFLHVLGLGYEIAKHGEQKKNNTYNAWYSLIGFIIHFGLLYWGGFFDCFL